MLQFLHQIWVTIASVAGFLAGAWILVLLVWQNRKFNRLIRKGLPWLSAAFANIMEWPITGLSVLVMLAVVFGVLAILEPLAPKMMNESDTGQALASGLQSVEDWSERVKNSAPPEGEGKVPPEGEGPPEGEESPEGENPPEGKVPPEGGDEPAGTAVPERVLKPESEWVSCLSSHYDADAIVVGNSPRWGQVQTVASHVPNGLYATLHWNHPNWKKNFGVLHLPYGPTLNLDKDVASPWKEVGTRLDSHPSDSGNTKVFKITGVGPWPDSCFETSETPTLTPDAADTPTAPAVDETPTPDADETVSVTPTSTPAVELKLCIAPGGVDALESWLEALGDGCREGAVKAWSEETTSDLFEAWPRYENGGKISVPSFCECP